jgi:hypothetical protein
MIGDVDCHNSALMGRIQSSPRLDMHLQVNRQFPEPTEVPLRTVGVAIIPAMLGCFFDQPLLQPGFAKIVGHDAIVVGVQDIRRQHRLLECGEILLVALIDLKPREATRVKHALEVATLFFWVAELLLVGPGDVKEVTAVDQVLPGASHRPRPLGQPGAPAPAHRVLAQRPGLEVQEGR